MCTLIDRWLQSIGTKTKLILKQTTQRLCASHQKWDIWLGFQAPVRPKFSIWFLDYFYFFVFIENDVVEDWNECLYICLLEIHLKQTHNVMDVDEMQPHRSSYCRVHFFLRYFRIHLAPLILCRFFLHSEPPYMHVIQVRLCSTRVCNFWFIIINYYYPRCPFACHSW